MGSEEASSGAAWLGLKGDGDGETAPEAAPGLAAAVSSAATTASSGVSREAAASRKPDGGSTRREEASGEAARLVLEGDGDGETAPEAAPGLAAVVSSAATTASSGVGPLSPFPINNEGFRKKTNERFRKKLG